MSSVDGTPGSASDSVPSPSAPLPPSGPPSVDDRPPAPSAPPVPPGGRRFVPTREYRAKWTFAAAAIFGFVVLFLAGGRISFGASNLGILLGPILGAVVHLIAAATLESRAPAARYAMTPLLWILVVVGLFSVAIALLRSTILFPVGAILAWYSLRAEPDPKLGPVPAASAGGMLLIAGSIVSSIIGLLGSV